MEPRKTIVITGGGTGLGKSLVELFLKKGWNVATCGRRQGKMDTLLREHGGGHLIAKSCDIRLENQVAGFAGEVSSRWGNIDAIVLNAGTVGPVPMPNVLNTTMVELRSTFETNFFANFNLIRIFREFLATPSFVVQITSDASREAYPGWGSYASSKAALDQLVRVLNAESGGSGVRGIVLDPGDMNTEMHRTALPDDDPESLKDPADSAREIADALLKLLGGL